MFSERLKLARKRSGLSLRELSSNMGGIVSAQAIGKYERGEMMPSSSVAIALAKALDVSTTYLLSPSAISLESVEFRKLAATKASARAMVEATVLDHVDRYLQVEDILGIADSGREASVNDLWPIETVEDAEQAAISMPRRLEPWGQPNSRPHRAAGGTRDQGPQTGSAPVRGRSQLPCPPYGRGAKCPLWSAPPQSQLNDTGSPWPTSSGTW